jgi:tetratricopeptide (TPR) repeat protein
VLLYKLLYGERPNGDPSSHAKGRRIARDLDAIVTKALAHRPEDRYPSGKELREDLERYRRALPVAARPRSMPRTAKLARRYRWQAITVTVLVAAIATVGYLVRDNRRKVVERRRQAVMAILTLFFDNDRREIGVPQSADTRRMALQPMLRKLEALERDSGEDAEVLYRIAIGYVFVGRIQAGFPTAVGDYGSGLQTYQRAAALAARAVAKSGGIREKQLLAQILHRVIITALWSNEGRAASVAAADGFQMMKASQAQFRQAGLGDFAVYYRIAFSIHRAHILQSENRLEEAAGLWSAALRELPTEVVLKDSSLGYVGIYSAFEANLRLAEHFCWSGNPRAGIPYAAAAEVLAARTSKITHDPDLERQARVIGAVCDTKASRPREALHTLDSLQRAYQKDLENQPQNTNFKEALANVGRLAGDAMVAIGDLTSAEEAYRSAQSFLLSPAEFANSPTAQIRTAQIAASLGQLESQRANRSPRGSARAVRHWKAACASYEQADAIFRKRRTGVMYIEDRVAMAEVEGAFSACEAAGDRIAPK